MTYNKNDIKASQRKRDHIGLAFESHVPFSERDKRFYYEPAVNAMNSEKSDVSINFLGSNLSAPLWVSSMTGGTEMARVINSNLAKACKEFSLGMGLGSCRQILDNDETLSDFDVREIIGIQPLYANLGIAQVIEIVQREDYQKIINLLNKLGADGLFIHINPLQEWMQPEGDKIEMSPVKCIEDLLDNLQIKVVVKEVGQGFGPQSLKALLELDIAGIELAGFGGTNFAKLETLRREKAFHSELINVGHTALEMIEFLNDLARNNFEYMKKEIIISGGVNDYLTGYYLNQKCEYSSVYGQASAFLKYAKEDYKSLAKYVEEQIKGYQIASQYLTIAK
jgi:isopentenyl-diphosphate delta-isomerase